jgi:tetratricopeptide (TPR) repeat protein
MQTICAAEQWLKITSANFELLTTAGEKKGREAILYFEQVRTLFSRLSKSGGAPALPVRIVAFQSDKEYRPYRLNEFAFAFYVGDKDRDSIVMKSIDADLYPVAIHEYTHLIVNHAGLPLPAWLNEGLADVYSTLKPSSNKVLIGEVQVGRFRELQTGKWLDLETLLAVDHRSPYYNEKQKAGMFYAQSWALAHMLYFSDAYRERFSQFLALIKADGSQAAVFQQVYGKSLSQVKSNLEAYLRGTHFNAALFDVKVEKSAQAPEVRPATPLESGMALADLLALTRKREEAKAAYESLILANPQNSEVELAMAHLGWMNSDQEEVRRHFARAIELGTANAKVYFDYAMLLQGQGKDPEITALLRKAVALKPDLVEAHYMLGFYDSSAGRFGQAIADFRQVKKVEKVQAFPYFRALAYAYYRLGQMEEARKNAENALKFASEPSHVELAKEFLAYLREPSTKGPAPALPPVENSDGRPRLARRDGAFEPPVAEPPAPPREMTFPIEGTLQQVDCLGKMARLRVQVAGKPMAFLIEDPAAVTVTRGRHDFTCGPQKPVAVSLEYVHRVDPKFETEGLIRSIEFRQ